MLFKNITILDENMNIRENCFVAVDGSRISYIGDKAPEGDHGEVIEGKGRLLMPAFYNAHAHTPMTLLRGYGGGLALNDWLTTKIFPFEAKLRPDDVYHGMTLGIAEMLKFGIVSTTDMYMKGESMIRAAIDTGVKINYGAGLVAFDRSKTMKELSDYIESKRLYEEYHGSNDGRIKVDMGVHAEYTSFPEVVKEFCDFSRSLGTNMQVHLSETQKEHEECKQRHGKTPAQYFNDLGMFDSPTTAAHCIWLEDRDFEIFAEKGVSVASCPMSNMKLASGIADISRMLEEGINVCIATDGVASNNSTNMISEMKAFALLQKVKHLDPTKITSDQALHAATAAGAIAQGRPDCGVLKVGNRADLIVLDIDQPHMLPVHDMKENLVYSADGADVEMTVCDGKILYRNGEYTTIDIEKTVYEVEASRKRILGELQE